MPTGDDHDLVDGLGDLGQDVAGDQHGAARSARLAQEPAQPVDTFRIQAVGWLVQDQHLGSPSRAVARLWRWRMPSENPPTRRPAASASPTWARTSSARARGEPAAVATTRR